MFFTVQVTEKSCPAAKVAEAETPITSARSGAASLVAVAVTAGVLVTLDVGVARVGVAVGSGVLVGVLVGLAAAVWVRPA